MSWTILKHIFKLYIIFSYNFLNYAIFLMKNIHHRCCFCLSFSSLNKGFWLLLGITSSSLHYFARVNQRQVIYILWTSSEIITCYKQHNLQFISLSICHCLGPGQLLTETKKGRWRKPWSPETQEPTLQLRRVPANTRIGMSGCAKLRWDKESKEEKTTIGWD